MAKARDYKALYARRVALGAARGESKAKSRGHGSNATENLQRRVNTATKKTAGDLGLKTWRDTVKSQQKKFIASEGPIKGRERMLNLLRDKERRTKNFKDAIKGGSTYVNAAYDTGAREDWDDRDQSIPDEFYWYHGD